MNASSKPLHSNAGATRNFNRTRTTQSSAANVNRAQVKHGQRSVVRENNQFNATRNRNVVVNQTNNRNVVVNTGAKRRFAVVSGNPISFAQARQWNWHQRHDRGWWVAQDYPIVQYGGGYWFWNNGWWYPAYGYDPYYSRYVYDGPIYGYGNVTPWDVTSQVQGTLAQKGYYYGPIDGILGPMTRRAIARYQIDHGLPETAAIDRPTLRYLGLA